MSAQLGRMAALLEHEIIEAAKISWRADESMPFIQHLAAEARARCGTEWNFETSCRRDGVWGLTLEYAAKAEDIHDPTFL